MPIYQRGPGTTPAFVPALVWNEVPSGTVNGTNATFTIAYTPYSSASIAVIVNGSTMKNPDDYSISTTTITFVTAPPTGSTILVNYQRQ